MKKLSVIYDVTALCPWNCAICCMGATTDKTCRKAELTQMQKLDIARQVRELQENGYDVRMDLSGGELFTDIPAHTELLTAISEVLGRDKLGVSCSGYGIDQELASFLSTTVHDVEMTMDVVPYRPYQLRPVGYSVAAAKAVELLKKAGCEVGIQTVASTYNSGYADALAVFAWACANGVDNWSILRFFPSGRGAAFPNAAMNDTQCEAYVRMVHEMVDSIPVVHKPHVDFHYLMPGHEKYTNICRCVRHSIGILPNGDVVACFWALDSTTGAVDSKFLLGNVKDTSLLEILNGEKARYWSDCEHCCELGSSYSSERSIA
jgi:MoaA/NifB/PqqE/SkfB family radical SAM enzyme